MFTIEGPVYRWRTGWDERLVPSPPRDPMFWRKKKSVFRGRIDSGQCVVRFRLQGRSEEGLAILDTGADGLLMSARFFRKAELKAIEGRTVSVEGLGNNEAVTVPMTELAVTLIAEEGPDFNCKGEVAVNEISGRLDLWIGLNVIRLGTFVVDGPSGTWTWTIDRRRIEKDRIPKE